MNTRKYFAGKALSSILRSTVGNGLATSSREIKRMGELARDAADSLIAALREKPLKLENQEHIDYEKEISDIESIKGSLILGEIDGDNLVIKE